MPTLDEIRAWARGLFVPGLHRYQPSEPPPEEAPRTALRTATYKINADGTDALIKFGKHRGRTISWLAANRQSYLRWILNGGKGRTDRTPFDDALLDVIRYQLSEVGREDT